jgi:hypothetical protein
MVELFADPMIATPPGAETELITVGGGGGAVPAVAEAGMVLPTALADAVGWGGAPEGVG